jgi:hypothetical protein
MGHDVTRIEFSLCCSVQSLYLHDQNVNMLELGVLVESGAQSPPPAVGKFTTDKLSGSLGVQ